ncbi:olfactory receptor 5AR1-like [Pleurodeles waltl]|uniref:olfactory receptor 5AR1-like n=1 Tax=Pleurodeles waltl TaxID=8319 RepID=UPI00370994A8
MDNPNQTRFSGFILLGLSSNPNYQILLFVIFLSLYVVNMLGNTIMILTITMYSGLHSPMYFFLWNLSILDMGLTSSTIPKLLLDFVSEVKYISFASCVVQLYSFISFGGMECVLLGVMSLDRYVAVCKPLRYSVIMNRSVCLILAGISWTVGLLNSVVQTAFTFHLPFCGSNQINHFFCDIPPLLALSCTNIHMNQIMLYLAMVIVSCSFLLTLLSYVFIMQAILKIRTAEGRQKAFSTCISHLTVVSLYFVTIVFTYIRPESHFSLYQDTVVPVLYSAVTPTLNPVIYSLRNKEVQGILKKAKYRTLEFFTRRQMLLPR